MSESKTIHRAEAGGTDPRPVVAASQPSGLSPAEGLRLFRALASIQDATLRKNVIHLVELLAATGPKR